MKELNKVEEPDDRPIETDEDTKEEEEIGSSGLYPYDPSEADIDVKEDPQSVFQLMRKYDMKELQVDPEFQRNLVWKIEQQSRFIESVILNFPLPPFYINEKKDGKFILIDGLQRTTSLHRFINDEFKLKGLEALTRLNGMSFSDLDRRLQRKIEDKKLLLYILKPSVPLKVVYDLFYRINIGGTQLNRQEVRHCIYMGESTRLLKKLSEKDYFRKAIDDGIKSTRMKDREAILRFLAFSIYDYSTDYKGDLSDFLENAMVKINGMQGQEIEKLEKNFKRVMEMTFVFFGKKNFRFPTERSRGRINIAMLETVCYFFFKHQDKFLLANKEKIKNNFKDLISNKDYFDAARYATGDKTRVNTRFNLALEILGAGCVEA